MKLVSIVINNYNYGRFVADAIESALAQTWPSVQVIVVDDGSTDESREIIARYRGRMEIVLQDNRGQVSALNRGFRESSGEFVLFLDSDDRLEPTAIERAVEAWKPGTAKVHFPLRVMDAKGNVRPALMPRARLAEGSLAPVLLEKGVYIGPPVSGNLYSREVLAQVMPIPDLVREHADCYLNAVTPFFGEVRAVHEPLGFYRVHSRSVTNVAVGGVDPAQIRKLMVHSLRERQVLEEFARARNLRLSPSAVLSHWVHLKLRLASVKLSEPKESGLWRVAGRFVRSVWDSGDELDTATRLKFTAWAAAMTVAPRFLAPALISRAFGHEAA